MPSPTVLKAHKCASRSIRVCAQPHSSEGTKKCASRSIRICAQPNSSEGTKKCASRNIRICAQPNSSEGTLLHPGLWRVSLRSKEIKTPDLRISEEPVCVRRRALRWHKAAPRREACQCLRPRAGRSSTGHVKRGRRGCAKAEARSASSVPRSRLAAASAETHAVSQPQASSTGRSKRPEHGKAHGCRSTWPLLWPWFRCLLGARVRSEEEEEE